MGLRDAVDVADFYATEASPQADPIAWLRRDIRCPSGTVILSCLLRGG